MKHKPIVITYGFHPERKFSGHIYELIDYYIHLKQHFENVYIWLPSNLQPSFFEKCLRYRIKGSYLTLFNNYLIRDTSLLQKAIILSCDGFIFPKLHKTFICDTFIALRCDKDYLNDYIYANHKILLQDFNLYNDVYPGFNKVLHYIKKIYYECIAYDEGSYQKRYPYLLYINQELKMFNPIYRDFCSNHNVLIIAPPHARNISYKEVKYLPIRNIFSLFEAYVYVNPINNFDCSPRFILECKYFDKDVIFLEKPPSSTIYRYNLSLNETDLSKDSFILEVISNYI